MSRENLCGCDICLGDAEGPVPEADVLAQKDPFVRGRERRLSASLRGQRAARRKHGEDPQPEPRTS